MVDVLAEPSLPPPGCAMPPLTALDRLARSPALRKPPCLAGIFLQNHLLCLTLSPTLAPCAAASPKTTSQGFTGPQGGAATSDSAEAGGSTDADTGSGSAAAGRGPGSAGAGAGRAGTTAGGRSGSASGGGGTQAGTSAGGPGDSPAGSGAADRAGAGDVRSDSADGAALPPTAESRAGDIESTDSVLSVIQANPDLSSLYDAIEVRPRVGQVVHPLCAPVGKCSRAASTPCTACGFHPSHWGATPCSPVACGTVLRACGHAGGPGAGGHGVCAHQSRHATGCAWGGAVGTGRGGTVALESMQTDCQEHGAWRHRMLPSSSPPAWAPAGSKIPCAALPLQPSRTLPLPWDPTRMPCSQTVTLSRL